MQINFKPLCNEDFPLVKEIYDWYILNSVATFHTEPISIDELKEFIYINHSYYGSYLIMVDGVVAGYYYLTYYKKRQAFNRTAELTLYLKPDFVGNGIGNDVLMHAESSAQKAGLKTLLAIITGENSGSVRLFEKNGYEKCAHFKNVGEKFGRILDVVAYQKMV